MFLKIKEDVMKLLVEEVSLEIYIKHLKIPLEAMVLKMSILVFSNALPLLIF